MYAEGGHAAGVGASPVLSEPVIDPQWPAVSTHWGAINVPLHPNAPPIRTSATYGNDPGGAAFPPTTAPAEDGPPARIASAHKHGKDIFRTNRIRSMLRAEGRWPRWSSTVPAMLELRFRFVCAPSALEGAPAGWAGEMLRDGEVALLADEGLDAINSVAHELDLPTIPVVRSEDSAESQHGTVIAYAGSLPLVWVSPEFGDTVTTWARARGPMTLLVASEGALAEQERRRIDRFVASLSRQSE